MIEKKIRICEVCGVTSETHKIHYHPKSNMTLCNKHYRCTRCGERKYMGCDTSPNGCKYFKFPRCIYVTENNPECYRMRK